VGSGAIARGLARVAVDHHDVVLWARSESSAESAAAHVGEADVVTDLDALAECDVAVEAVTEDEQVKREVLGRQGQLAVGGQPARVDLPDECAELRGGVVPGSGGVLERDQAPVTDELPGDPDGVLDPGPGDQPPREQSGQRTADTASHGHVGNRSAPVCALVGPRVAARAWQEN